MRAMIRLTYCSELDCEPPKAGSGYWLCDATTDENRDLAISNTEPVRIIKHDEGYRAHVGRDENERYGLIMEGVEDALAELFFIENKD